MDETVSGVNLGCVIPERYNLPGLGDSQAGYPLRGRQTEISSFSLDIKAAHQVPIDARTRQRIGGHNFSGSDLFLPGHAVRHELLGILVAKVVSLFHPHLAPLAVLGTLLIDVRRRFNPDDVYWRFGHIGLPASSLCSLFRYQDFVAETAAGLGYLMDRLAALLQSGYGTRP